MRAEIYAALATDAGLRSLGLGEDSVYAAESVEDPPLRPFIVIRWQPTLPGMGPSLRNSFDVWVQDDPGDFARIDAMLFRVKSVLVSLTGTLTDSGYLTLVDWLEDSADQRDDVWGTINRRASFLAIGAGR